MKQGYILLPGLALALTLAGCAGAAHPLGEEQPDLVVYNDSTAIIGSITVSSDRESQGVAMADGSPLERGGVLWISGGRDRAGHRRAMGSGTAQPGPLPGEDGRAAHAGHAG